jgi:hypothetical protein
MHHTREEVIERTIQEYALLDQVVASLSEQDWARKLPRSESKVPWTIKDALAHITHWKADVIRSMHRRRRPPEERGLTENEENQQIYLRWRDRSPQEVLAWHRQVQEEVLGALREAPDAWFSSRERRAEWPYDLDGHSLDHRVKDIQRALEDKSGI